MTLGEKQELFTRLAFGPGGLVSKAIDMGFTVRVGEVERSEAAAEAMAAAGKGIARSLHRLRLAVDLHLFRDGLYLTRSEDHAALGAWWKAQHALCRWGGDFSRPDGNHYSVTHDGRA